MNRLGFFGRQKQKKFLGVSGLGGLRSAGLVSVGCWGLGVVVGLGVGFLGNGGWRWKAGHRFWLWRFWSCRLRGVCWGRALRSGRLLSYWVCGGFGMGFLCGMCNL